LVVVRLIPYVIWSPIGGSFADSKDRRIVMIGLDCLGALVPLLYLVAYHAQSIVFVYMVAFCQHSIASIYEPSRASFVPLLVTNEASLKKAVTLSGIVWSTMTAIGSSLGGFTIAFLGVEACFCTCVYHMQCIATSNATIERVLIYLSFSFDSF
jgi:MFS family permease